jgi:ParB family chromosome partitioning protein
MSQPNPTSLSSEPSQLKLNNLARLQSKLTSGADSISSIPVGDTVRLSLECIVLSESQPRRYFSPEELEKLKLSLHTQGLLNALIVRPYQKGLYQLVAGERRYRAAQSLGWREIPVKILELDDREAAQVSLVENLQREDLNPLEQTEGILSLLEMRLGLSQEEIVKLLYRLHNEHTGKVSTKNVFGSSVHAEIKATFDELGQIDWLSFVVCRLPLRNLSPDILTVLRQGKLAYTKARAIAKIKEEESRQQLLQEAVEQDFTLSQINQRIKALTAKQPHSVGSDLSTRERWKRLNKKVSQLKLWEDPNVCQKLEILLEQIEALVDKS